MAGGVWKTDDGGHNWSPLAAFQANLNVSCLVMDPADPRVIYAGTGEGFANVDANRGEGIFRTTDGGKNWDQLTQTQVPAFRYVNRLALLDGRVLLAATPGGVFRSDNPRPLGRPRPARRGATFHPVVVPVDGETLDVRFHPTNAALCVAGGREGKAFYSTNGGVNWSPAAGITPVPLGPFGIGGRVELTYALAGGSRVVYASVDADTGLLYRSDDGGRTYAPTGNTTDYLGGQGWYDNTVWAGDPADENLVLVGGVELYRSTDGGAVLTPITDWDLYPRTSPHADQHAVAHPGFGVGGNRTVYVASDGGVSMTDDVRVVSPSARWTSLNHGLGITQFYNASASVSTGRVLGGAQDTNSLTPAGGTRASSLRKGDGGFCAFDTSDPSHAYFEYVYGYVFRSTNGGESESDWITDTPNGDLEVGQNAAPFVVPFILDPNNPRVMYFGSRSLFRTPDVRARTPRFRRSSRPSRGAFVSAIAARRTGGATSGDSNAVWVGHDDGSVFRTRDAAEASPTWERVNGPGSRRCRRAGCVRGSCSTPRTRTGSSSVLPATAGITSGGRPTGRRAGDVLGAPPPCPMPADVLKVFPDVSVHDVAIHPDHPAFLYVATEVGILASGDGGTTGRHEPRARERVDPSAFLDRPGAGGRHARPGAWSGST